MGRKSSGQDKGEGVVDKAKGRAKEAAGAVTGDETTKSEGRAEQTKGTAEKAKGKIKDTLK
ncbi:MAG: CsbD family protein [Actinomycetota bacterium]|nr:CsbD family protein [Actinomycetota bacterium]